MEEKKCSNPNCSGKIDKNKVIQLRPGFTLALVQTNPCNICGLLHKVTDGTAMTYLRKEKTFLINGRILAGGIDVTVYFL
jgi:hypothetical protein